MELGERAVLFDGELQAVAFKVQRVVVYLVSWGCAVCRVDQLHLRADEVMRYYLLHVFTELEFDDSLFVEVAFKLVS